MEYKGVTIQVFPTSQISFLSILWKCNIISEFLLRIQFREYFRRHALTFRSVDDCKRCTINLLISYTVWCVSFLVTIRSTNCLPFVKARWRRGRRTTVRVFEFQLRLTGHSKWNLCTNILFAGMPGTDIFLWGKCITVLCRYETVECKRNSEWRFHAKLFHIALRNLMESIGIFITKLPWNDPTCLCLSTRDNLPIILTGNRINMNVLIRFRYITCTISSFS